MNINFICAAAPAVQLSSRKAPSLKNERKAPQYHFFRYLQDDVKYYENVPASYSDMWVDLDSLNASSGIVKEHPMLSKSYRRAATIKLSFRFPFYGHEVENITIATGGFLYTGTYVHSWLAATQYIAPLMANFDTSQDDAAKIRYADNSECARNSNSELLFYIYLLGRSISYTSHLFCYQPLEAEIAL